MKRDGCLNGRKDGRKEGTKEKERGWKTWEEEENEMREGKMKRICRKNEKTKGRQKWRGGGERNEGVETRAKEKKQKDKNQGEKCEGH